jgi:hypothetical protein
MKSRTFFLLALSTALVGFTAPGAPSGCFPMQQANLIHFESHDLVVSDLKKKLIMYGVPNEGYRMKPTTLLLIEENETHCTEDCPKTETQYKVSAVTRLPSGGLKIEANEIFTQIEDERMPRRLEIIDHSVSPENSTHYGWMISLIDTEGTAHLAGNPVVVR